MKKRVLVYPCGTEIGLEIYRSVNKSIHFELYGGSSSYDHGRFVYDNHLEGLPFITDSSSKAEIIEFNRMIKKLKIDFIYPAMDGVLFKFSEFSSLLEPTIIAPDDRTVATTRSKRKTYELFEKVITVPKLFNLNSEELVFPLFLKPDVGQGSKGAYIVHNINELEFLYHKNKMNENLILEYLPGEEYTVDCFTNSEGKLIYAGGRKRNRIKGGISVNATEENDEELLKIAEIINSKLRQKGGWFFQVKKNNFGEYSLLEVSSRIAGTSSFTRNMGINLPLLTLHTYNGENIEKIIKNNYKIEEDRALYNRFNGDITYSRVYVDYDDTLIINNKINTELITLLYQCINEKIPITLITKHKKQIKKELKDRKLDNLFDEVIHLSEDEEKFKFISEKKSIFIDDSYGERLKVNDKMGINVFDTHMIECLLK